MKSLNHFLLILLIPFGLTILSCGEESNEAPEEEFPVIEYEEGSPEIEDINSDTELAGLVKGEWISHVGGSDYLTLHEDGTYNGFDGEEEYAGNWEVIEGRMKLGEGEEYPLRTDGEYLMIGEMVFRKK